MNLPFELQIGLRYTRAKRRGAQRNRFISFISAISMFGIALGVAALIIVLSVMNGFQKDVRDRMLSVLSHIEVFAVSESISDWRHVAQQASRNPKIIGAAPYVGAQAMLMRGDELQGTLVRGIDPQEEPKVSDIGQQMKQGNLQNLKPGEFGIILGSDLARNLGAVVGNKVTLLAPQGNVTPAGVVPRLKQFTLVGVFESGHIQYDSGLALLHLQDAQKMFQQSGVTGVRLKTSDMQLAPEIALELSRTLDAGLYLRDWSHQNRNWFVAVQVEKRMLFIILTLIIAVAAFNLVSTLVMTVTEKSADIAILRTLGASPRSIMKIFVVQGALIGFLGTALGVGGGCLIAYNIDVIVPVIERALGFHFIPKDVYLIGTLPSDPKLSDILTIGVLSLVLSLIATLYPSWRAAQIKPAEALRYE